MQYIMFEYSLGLRFRENKHNICGTPRAFSYFVDAKKQQRRGEGERERVMGILQEKELALVTAFMLDKRRTQSTVHGEFESIHTILI